MVEINDRRLPVGIQSFEVIREGGYLYVDKTDIIWQLANRDKKYNYLSRPRRFGKSLTSSMLQNFLEMDYTKPADRTRQEMLFAGLDILQDEMFCEEWMGKWPVLSVS